MYIQPSIVGFILGVIVTIVIEVVIGIIIYKKTNEVFNFDDTSCDEDEIVLIPKEKVTPYLEKVD